MEWCTVDEKLDKITIEHFARVLALISTRLLQSDNSRRIRKHSCFYRVVFASVFLLEAASTFQDHLEQDYLDQSIWTYILSQQYAANCFLSVSHCQSESPKTFHESVYHNMESH